MCLRHRGTRQRLWSHRNEGNRHFGAIVLKRALRWTVGWFRRPREVLVSTFCGDFLPLYLTARPATKAPGHLTDTYWVVAARRPPMEQTAQHCTYRNLCCTVYDACVPLRHFTDCQDGAANGAGPSECTAGVTPAPSVNLGQRTEARIGPGPLYTRNGKRPPTIQSTCDDTASWPPRRPADGQQRAAL